jgi:outer membrane protein assembly factor BamB
MQKPLRLWPGIAAATVFVTGYGAAFVLPAAADIGLIAAGVSVLVMAVWWLFLSRAPWLERLAAVVAMVLAVLVTRPFLDKSIAGGAMGALQYGLSVPLMCLALVAWAFGTRRLSDRARRVSLPAVMLLTCAFVTLLRTDGIGGATIFELRWRWMPTAEERLLAEVKDEPIAPIAAPLANASVPPAAARPLAAPHADAPREEKAPTAPARPPLLPDATAARPAIWPGFRGPERDGVVHGVQIATDWSKSPPTELWRRRIGPGWSSFAVDGDLFYTQEQRGEEELVACYRLSTGEPVWRHRDAVRFWESNGGAGPRGTPTLSSGRVFALGATGILNALDARTGVSAWSRNAAADTKTAVPDWGISSSPLVIGDVVIVATGGALAGYDVVTGKPRWLGKDNGFSYSSPHLLTIDGVPQVLLLSPHVTSVAPADGTVLWQLVSEGGGIVQPAVIANGEILVAATGGTSGGAGIRRLGVTHGAAAWSVEERWTSTGLKPFFNDFVVHKGHAFGFDGSILASIDLADGKRAWKGGRYGSGQLVLLPDQDLLLVLSEEGELALVSATPDKFTEVARARAIDGKTWNHPVLVGDVLLVRNGEEMAAFRLPRAAR